MKSTKILTLEDLQEQFPDDEYKKTKNSDGDNKFLENIRGLTNRNELLPFDKLVRIGILFCDQKNEFVISGRLRRLWRAGKIRRFVAGIWEENDKTRNGGKWYGVHYIL